MRIKLILTIDYEPNGVSSRELAEMVSGIVRRAASEGMMTGETPATVDAYRAIIETSDGITLFE